MLQEMSFDQLEKLQRHNSDLMVIDVCEQLEPDQRVVVDEHWPLSTFGLRETKLSQSRPTMFVCKTGLASMQAAEIASQWTQQPVYYLAGGYLGLRPVNGMRSKVRMSQVSQDSV